MPLVIPSDLPAKSILEKEQIFTMTTQRAETQDIRPLKLAILNLMPKKEETETQLLRMLSNTALQVHVDLIRTDSHKSKNTDYSHLHRFYKTFDEIKQNKYDAMIITGAPIETMEYENVDYWQEFTEILEYAKEHVFSTMFICWASQAALYHYYGIKKHQKSKKIFGVYEFDLKKRGTLTKGFDDSFFIPQSRYTYNELKDVLSHPDLDVWAGREDIGANLVSSKDGRFLFVAGHFEYEEDTLYQEYLRDKAKGLGTDIPENYFIDNDEAKGIKVKWRSHANLFFSNWLNYCVYQETPYDISQISKKKVAKFGGSSLSDAGQFSKVKDIIYSSEDREIIVVSAPGKRNEKDTKITDILNQYYILKKDNNDLMQLEEKIQRFRKENEEKKENSLDTIVNRFTDIAKELELSQETVAIIQNVISKIKDSDNRDFILSRGEYLNAILMAKYLNYEFLDAEDIIFFDNNGALNKRKTYQAIRQRMANHLKFVVPGFYGKTENGEIKTFDRGGSDITGSIIAGALHSELYENWTDVDGVMTADPNKDKTAKTIDHLSYEQLLRMAEKGANVYHLYAIEPVMKQEIPIHIRNTNNPSGKGTIVQKK
ncbi:MAG: homoserine O-succinyltransferase [Fusobacterium necrophorum]|nr:homoserine O-succinyltransferase [Fusobacterium necrophorum]